MKSEDRKYALERIEYQLEDGYIDLGCHDEDEIEVIREVINNYKKIPEIIEELKGLKMSMDGQIFYNQASKLIYEERMESTNNTVDEAISIVKQLLGN